MDLDEETTLTVSVATFLLLPILWIKVQRSKRIQPTYKRVLLVLNIRLKTFSLLGLVAMKMRRCNIDLPFTMRLRHLYIAFCFPLSSLINQWITMGLIFLFSLVVLCTKAYTEYEYYTNIFQLATLLVCVLLLMLVTKAYRRERMYKLGIMISITVIMLAFVALFVREPTPKHSPPVLIPSPSPLPSPLPSPSPPPKGYLPPMHMPTESLRLPLDELDLYFDDLDLDFPMSMPSTPLLPLAPLVNQLNNVKTFNIKKITSKVCFIVFAVLCVCYGV